MATPAPGTAGSPSRRILVVDDNEDAASTLAMILRMLGQDVRVAFTGGAALAEADAFQPEAIFLDIGLPDLDGYDVARQLRTRPTSRQTLIVALTGFGQEEARQRAEEAGFDRHLVKPLELEVIQEILAQMNSRPNS